MALEDGRKPRALRAFCNNTHCFVEEVEATKTANDHSKVIAEDLDDSDEAWNVFQAAAAVDEGKLLNYAMRMWAVDV